MSGADVMPLEVQMPMTARRAAQLIRQHSLSPAELLERCIRRIHAVEPVVQAFAALDEHAARAEAATLTREAAAGRFRGPLHGVPVAVKDVIDVAGFPTRAGSLVTDPAPVERDAPAVERLRAAGALILGKTHTHEFAHGVTTPPTRNPWNLERIAGGSSGGSAAAVASGQCLAAIGTDTGGSIRVPAALCGVTGLRPTPGVIPVGGVFPFSPKLDTCGPITSDVADAALMYSVLSASDCTIGDSISGIRIGALDPDCLGELAGAVQEATVDVVQTLRTAGGSVSWIRTPDFTAWSAPRARYVVADFLQVHRMAGFYPDRADRYGSDVASYLRQAQDITADAYSTAARELDVLAERMTSAAADKDVVVLPTTPITAPPITDCLFDPTQPGRAAVVGTLMRLSGPFSWLGWAAVTVPGGTDPDGMPIGIQVAGREVTTVLTVAAALQRHMTCDLPPS